MDINKTNTSQENMRFCTQCGRAISPNSVFCNYCAAPIAKAVSKEPNEAEQSVHQTNQTEQFTTPEKSWVFCTVCGAKNNSDCSFCTKCGNVLVKESGVGKCTCTCGHLNPVGNTFCESCGRPIGNGAYAPSTGVNTENFIVRLWKKNKPAFAASCGCILLAFITVVVVIASAESGGGGNYTYQYGGAAGGNTIGGISTSGSASANDYTPTQGNDYNFIITTSDICTKCHGSGVCAACNGRGGLHYNTYGQGGSGWVDCVGCNGTRKCNKCNGTGRLS